MNIGPSRLALGAVLLVVACGGNPATTVTTSATPAVAGGGAAVDAGPSIVSVWRSRCSQCHSPVAPKTRDRAHLEVALARHHTRVRLTDARWDQMIDYLAR